MSEPNLECSSTSAHPWPCSGLYKSIVRSWHWRRLKWLVAAASEAAQGHEANGLQPGADHFRKLYESVEDAMLQYRSNGGTESNLEIEARLPNILMLKRLAEPSAQAPKTSAPLIGLTAVVASVFLTVWISCLVGFGEGIVHFLSHLVGR
jgi:hypothetical protein